MGIPAGTETRLTVDEGGLAAAAGAADVDRHASRIARRTMTIGMLAISMVLFARSIDPEQLAGGPLPAPRESGDDLLRRALEIATLCAAPLMVSLALLRTRVMLLRQRRRRLALLTASPQGSIRSTGEGDPFDGAPRYLEPLFATTRHERLTEQSVRELNDWSVRVMQGTVAMLATASILLPWVALMRAAGSLE
ncbi:MAG TPA: hypothetical protein DCQ98_20655 [Planctomycetaceae bacterium]|nr:hypothetical protein [Planctomycetaceae bacterium]